MSTDPWKDYPGLKLLYDIDRPKRARINVIREAKRSVPVEARWFIEQYEEAEAAAIFAAVEAHLALEKEEAQCLNRNSSTACPSGTSATSPEPSAPPSGSPAPSSNGMY